MHLPDVPKGSYPQVFAHLLPTLADPSEFQGGVAVVFDILRASTTIVHALAAGAECIVPTLSVEEAFVKAGTFAATNVVLGGERDGVLIPGFDLDNNPLAYTADRVSGKSIVFTTTNGTMACLRAAQASRILIGAFVNLSAVVSELEHETRPIHLLCAGTRGKITTEDVLAAGAVAVRLGNAWGIAPETFADDQVQIAAALYQQNSGSMDSIVEKVGSGYGGRNCRRLGFENQIRRAGTIDLFDFVPEYDTQTGLIARTSSP